MSQKTPIGASLGQQARRRALAHIQNTGKALPASVKKVKGSIITVDFDLSAGYQLPSVTIPHFGPEYTRYPTQKGDRGVVLATDSLIGHVSALGPKDAPGLSRPGNLSPLIFLPIASANWSNVDGDKINHYGKTGAVSSDQGYQSVQITHYKDQPGGKKGFAGWARGKPQNNFDSANIDPTKFDHYSVGNDDGITHGTKGDHNVNASGDNSNSNVTAKKSHNVNAESTNLKGADGSSDTTLNVQGNSNTSKDHNVGQTLKAALGAFGGLGGNSGGGAGSQIPGNLNMGGQISGGGLSISGVLQYAAQYLQPATGATIPLLLVKPFTFIDPTGALAALTLSFPGSPQDGDVIAVSFTRAVTTLSFSGGSFGANNPATIPAAGAQFRWMFIAAPGLWLLF